MTLLIISDVYKNFCFLQIINSKHSGAVHMSRASPANRADSMLWWLKYLGELKLKGVAALSNIKACHQAK